MITVPTVLILGAGSNIHLGYPLGYQLVNKLCAIRKLSRDTEELNDLPDDWTREKIESFIIKLSRSAYPSIDAFLERTPEYIRIGKYLIARELKKCEDIDRLFPPHDSGWYQYLFESLLVDKEPRFEENRIWIITFNYDRSLECYLHNVLMNRFGLDSVAASEILSRLPIVHVHGILGQYPRVPYIGKCSNDVLLDISRQIQIVHEIADNGTGFCSDAFKQANEFLQNAHRIYFLGFGFHEDNMKRMRFFYGTNISDKTVRMASYPMHPKEKENFLRRTRQFGFDSSIVQDIQPCDQFFGRVGYLA